ncbi:hypothetical protein E4T38_09241 [Aureobasidium subglaciale]|nr:hypothetical protein E4T38_09241 [Aureobasidium subglaciale]KAI5214228.1 hypothetical protein E4T40_09155 [Aureobasidium subglaciale]KAI5216737.1 hypothetical protein E4T41_09156 [Aureobasidium subglaciale]KAI5254495.1 hypothetical protein E4T46_09148 [Aureobasidium subglaciale]
MVPPVAPDTARLLLLRLLLVEPRGNTQLWTGVGRTAGGISGGRNGHTAYDDIIRIKRKAESVAGLPAAATSTGPPAPATAPPAALAPAPATTSTPLSRPKIRILPPRPQAPVVVAAAATPNEESEEEEKARKVDLLLDAAGINAEDSDA